MIFEKYANLKYKYGNICYTYDFFVTRRDDSEVAYSVKNDKNLNEPILELLTVENMHWLM